MLVTNDRRLDHSENEETILGVLKQYSKCNNIIYSFRPHSIHVCQIVISTGGISENIFRDTAC